MIPPLRARLAYRLALRDRSDRFQRIWRALAGSAVPAAPPPAEADWNTAVKYAFPEPNEPIGDLDAHPGARGRIAVRTPLDQIEPSQAQACLDRAAELAGEWIIALAAFYPENLLRRPAGLQTSRRREWWAARLDDFELLESPRELIGGRSILLYRRKKTFPRATRTATSSGPLDAAFLIPPTRNSFREAFESLARAARAEGLRCELADPQSARDDPRVASAGVKIRWAHYWPAHRIVDLAPGTRFENFVANFVLEPRGRLTPWLEELVRRDTLKLTPSEFGREQLLSIGVPTESIHVVPHGYGEEFADPPAALPLATRKTFRFLAVVNSHDPRRFGTDLLLRAYRRAFPPSDDVCLVLKDYGGDPAATLAALRADGGPEVLYYANFLSKRELASFYRSCQAFVAPFRGEGFGMKILDAAAAGLPLILPLFGGPPDYADPAVIEPVRFDLAPVGDCLETREIAWREQLRWAQPDVDDLARAMRAVYDGYEPARARAARLQDSVLRDWSWRAAARKLIRVLDR